MEKALSSGSCGDTQLGEEVAHPLAQGFVMPVDGSPGVRFAAGSKLARGRQQWLDDLVPQDQQGGERSQTLGKDFIAMSPFDLANQFFGAKLLEVVSGSACSVLDQTERAHPLGQRRRVKPAGEADKASKALESRVACGAG